MIAFELQGAWWKTSLLNWTLICFLQKTAPRSIDLVTIADKLSGQPPPPHNTTTYCNTDTWSKKQWRKAYKRVPPQIKNLFEKNLRAVAQQKNLRATKRKKLAFKPFLISRIRSSNLRKKN